MRVLLRLSVTTTVAGALRFRFFFSGGCCDSAGSGDVRNSGGIIPVRNSRMRSMEAGSIGCSALSAWWHEGANPLTGGPIFSSSSASLTDAPELKRDKASPLSPVGAAAEEEVRAAGADAEEACSAGEAAVGVEVNFGGASTAPSRHGFPKLATFPVFPLRLTTPEICSGDARSAAVA